MQAYRGDAVDAPLLAKFSERILGSGQYTPFRPAGRRSSLGKITNIRQPQRRNAGETSSAVAGTRRADQSIRQKVMGRSVPVARSRGRFARFRFRLGCAHAALALLDQPARDHRIGILVQILVEQGSNLLAQIRRVPKPGQLIALQRVLRSGQKELPRRLGALAVHVSLQYVGSNVLRQYNTARNSMITSHRRVHGLWKSVEKVEIPLRACSACAGDYEDPDRTAWGEGFQEEDCEEVRDEPASDE